MNIQNLKLLETLYPGNNTPLVKNTTGHSLITSQSDNKQSFSNMLTDSISNLENKQLASDHAIQGLVSGEADDLHNVMIKTAEAQISLEFAVQLRNRSLEAMNEIKNMQF